MPQFSAAGFLRNTQCRLGLHNLEWTLSWNLSPHKWFLDSILTIMHMEKSGYPTASRLVPLTSLFGDALKKTISKYTRLSDRAQDYGSLCWEIMGDISFHTLVFGKFHHRTVTIRTCMSLNIKSPRAVITRVISACFKYMIISCVTVYEHNIQLTTKKLLYLPLLLVTASYVHAVKAQHWLMNYPADHYHLLQLLYEPSVFLPVLLNHWQAMPEPDTVPGVFYDFAKQSPAVFDDHEDFLTSVQPETQLRDKHNSQGWIRCFPITNFEAPLLCSVYEHIHI